MLSWEIDSFLAQRKYVLNSEEYAELTPQKNPQISRLTYNTSTNTFYMSTYDGYSWEFKVFNN